MGLHILVLQQTNGEGPGRLILSAAEQLSLNLHIVRCWQTAIPDPNPFDGLIILGGFPNIEEESDYPFLREEKSFIKAWLDKDEIPGGQSLVEIISSGIHGCSHFILFISNHYLESSWCYEELSQVYPYFREEKV